MSKVAFLGLGRMGAPMAANVAAAGFPLVVYNRTREKAERFAAEYGVSVADSPRQAAAQAYVVISMLADESSVRAIYDGSNGVLAGVQPGTVAIHMGTTGPQGVEWLARVLREHGCALVDAPVSGSTAAARDGSLTILAVGSSEALELARPVLDSMGSPVYELGPSGSGAVMKLVVNSVIYSLGQALSEALVLAERAGLDRALAYDVFMHSAVAAPMVKYRRDAFVTPESTPTSFAMNLASKHLGLIEELALAVGAPMPQAAVNQQVLQEAIGSGLGDEDMAAVAVHLRSLGA